MNATKILDILMSDNHLFNARYYKDSEAAARHITQHYELVDVEQVRPVMDALVIHPGTGAVMDSM